MQNNIKHIILFLLLSLIFKWTNAQDVSRQKAMWIVGSFVPYTTWPNDGAIKNVSIGVVGESSDVYNELVDLSRTEKLKNAKFKVIKFDKVSDIKHTDLLYVTLDASRNIRSILARVDNQTMVVTDQLKNENLYMLNFLDLATNKKKYEINPKNITPKGFILDLNLFIHGGKTEDLKLLYREIGKKLAEEKSKYKKLKRDFDKYTSQFEALNEKNAEAINMNKRQKEINDQHKREIEQRQNELYEQEQQVIRIKEDIDYQTKQLDENRNILAAKTKKMKSYQDEMKNTKKEIARQDSLIEKNKKEIKNKDVTLSDQNYQLKRQWIMLSISIVFLIIALTLSSIVWRGYKKKQEVNLKLQETNKAINKQKEEISKQQKQTDMLNRELERLSIVASETGNAVTIMDIDGNFEWVNVGFTKLYGYTLQLLTHEIDENILGVSTHPDIENIFKKCRDTKTTQIYETQNDTRSGNTVWCQTSLTPITDQNGNVIKFITIETDITNIKDAEQKIRNQHAKVLEQTQQLEKSNKELERLSLVASETENAIAIMDAVGDFQWINEGFSRLYGYSFNRLIMEYSKNIIAQDTDQQIIKLIKKSIEQKVAVTFDRLEKHADGHEIWVQTTLSPITDNRNNMSNLISIATDISKIKEAEKAIIQKNEELIQKKDEIELQKNKIDTRNQNINASISYAKTIQNAILPPDDFLNKIFKTEIIYKPLEMVSGDFYWSSIIRSKSADSYIVFYAVVDCTGHGVPGAFMSMIGSSLLDEIVNEKKIFKPSVILENMNEEVKSVLRQEAATNYDSMEVCMCAIEKQKNSNNVKVVFSGAKRPLYYFSKRTQKVERIKGNRKTVGGIKALRNKEKFTDQEIILNKGDIVYLSSDGITEQLSENLEKFGNKRFINLIEQIGNQNLSTQKEKIIETYKNYTRNAKQRDDISFMAVQV